jgi:diadenosine tetraphosphate (Ap4A) HIT family hydrolase
MDSAQFESAQERRLWMDALIIVVVDKFASSPELLVTPRDTMMFPHKASIALLERLSSVAAAGREALMHAAGRACDSASANIYINPPAGLSVRQLHVHVVPQPPINVSDPRRFYAEVQKVLSTLLQRAR